MSKERLLSQFKDIVAPRRANNDAISFMARHWAPQSSYEVTKKLSPTDLKKATAESGRLDKILDELCVVLKKDKALLQKEVAVMLEEIGLDRKMYVVRWLGIFTTKVLCRVCTSVFVNERNMFNLKATMRHNPVVFVPTHRSYADFILMTYISFYYDIEFPAVAAGMDFHAMVGMGRVMRDTCAFYMRRTFASDPLYGAVFRQYVRTLVTQHHTPVEFFIEGTRSRSGKSMAPKYGFMSMVLEPLFAGEIPDVTFVPINISYDRVMEERLFAFELLGVPKPKESTSGLLKALNILSENFGSIYVNIGEPFSAKEYFGASLKRHLHAIKPVETLKVTPEENTLVQKLAHEIVYRQQRGALVTTFHMIAVSLTMSLHDKVLLKEDDLHKKVISLSELFKDLGGNVFDYDSSNVGNEVKLSLATHQNLVKWDKMGSLRLINSAPFLMTDEIKKKMKGHELSQETMSSVIPVVMLQLYVNPVLHWLVPSAVICLLTRSNYSNKDSFWQQYRHLRILLRHEFPINDGNMLTEYDKAMQFLLKSNTLQTSGDKFILGSNKTTQGIFSNLLWPFVNCLIRIGSCLLNEQTVEEKSALKTIQKDLEWHLLNKEDTHPYCLSLDSILNCVQGFVGDGALRKHRKKSSILYEINYPRLSEVTAWIKDISLNIAVKFDRSNPVMMEPRGILARL